MQLLVMLAWAVLFVTPISPAAATSTSGNCTPVLVAVGQCTLEPGTGELIVVGSEDVGGSALNEPVLENGPQPAPIVVHLTPYEECMTRWNDTVTCERANFTVIDNRPGAVPLVAAVPAITINDLAQFRPIVGELVVEPDGWGVVGTPTNFYATAETHTMAGELFDMPIEVRWTPSSYIFDYGDGTTETSEASGTAWRGAEESWTETATSHVYTERSDVTASLTVVFTAEVDAGGGWFAVPGTLPVAAPSVGVKIFEVDTVLTNGDCMANPSAAGCG